MTQKSMARVFVLNPGGAYDPAPLEEFDAIEGEFTPAVGDVLRWHEHGTAYKVVERFYDAGEARCTIIVERWAGPWPTV